MDNLKSSAENTVRDLKDYVQATLELYKLKAIEKSAMASATMMTWMCIGFFAGLMLLFLSIAGAIYINNIIGETYVGFLLVGLFYAVAGLIFFTGRKGWLRNSFADSIIKSIFSEK